MIRTRTVKIPKIDGFDNDYVEKVFAQQNISPVRWAIVDVDDKEITLSVSCASYNFCG